MTEKKKIHGCQADINLPSVEIATVTDASALLQAAQNFLRGVNVLSESSENVVVAKTFLAAQAMECALKSYLISFDDISWDDLKKTYGHKLDKLWQEAHARDLDISRTPPDWLKKLNELHNRPFYLRYPREIQMFDLPPINELSQLIEAVASKIG